jgi:3-hydroxyisobutyrate dehydrogenase-like beta-hydroxyacid dehydrogenase
MRIGFIGLGQMGSGMAGRLIAAGHEVSVYNRSPARAEPLPLVAGMRLQADVMLERRRLVEWLFAPLAGLGSRL